MNWPTHISDILPSSINQKMGFRVTRFRAIGMVSAAAAPVPPLFAAPAAAAAAAAAAAPPVDIDEDAVGAPVGLFTVL